MKYPNGNIQGTADWMVLEPRRRFWTRVLAVRVSPLKEGTEDSDRDETAEEKHDKKQEESSEDRTETEGEGGALEEPEAKRGRKEQSGATSRTSQSKSAIS